MDATVHSKGRDIGWWAALAGLFVLLAVPFFAVDVPPVLDYPNHLARIFVLAFGANDPVLSAMYAPHWRIIPNLVVDLVGPPLLHVLPVHVVGRLLLGAAAMVPVAGVVVYHRAAFGHRSYWPLAAGLAAFNGIFLLGFMNYLIGVGLAFAAGALWIRLADRRPASAAAVGAVSVAGLFFCHIMAVLLFALLVGAHELAALRRARDDRPVLLRRAGKHGAMLAVALAPGLALYACSTLAGAHSALTWEPPARKLLHLFSPFTAYNPSLGVATLLAVIAAAALFRRRAAIDAGTVIALAAVAVVYVLAPRHIQSGAVIDARLPVMMALLFFAGVEPKISRRAGFAVAGVVAALLVMRTADVAAAWREHRSDLAELRATYAPVEPGAKVLVLTAALAASDAYLGAEPRGRFVPFLYRTDDHLPGLMLIEKRAFWPLLFADPRQQPLIVRPPYDWLAAPLGQPPDYRLIADETFSQPAPARRPAYLDHWTEFDYVLLLDAGAIDAATFRPDRLELLNHSDMAALYRVKRP